MHEENHTLYLTLVDGRLRSISDIENLIVACARPPRSASTISPPSSAAPNPPLHRHRRRRPAVLLNIFSQPDASTLDIANNLNAQLHEISHASSRPDIKLAFFYDQSLLVRSSVAASGSHPLRPLPLRPHSLSLSERRRRRRSWPSSSSPSRCW